MAYDYTILECRHFTAPGSSNKIERVVKDYEFDFYLKGDRVMYIDDRKYVIKKNDVVFRCPGQRVYSYGEYDCYIFTLDFSGKRSCIDYSRNVADTLQEESRHTMLDIFQKSGPVFPSVHTDSLKFVLEQLSLQYDLNQEQSKALSWEILSLINADASHAYTSKHHVRMDVMDSVRQYLDQNYVNPISLDRISEMFCVNKYHLIRTFKKKFHITPINYLIAVRLSNARELLMGIDLSVKSIAWMVGYNDESYFVKEYEKKYNITPYKDRIVNRSSFLRQ